MKQLDHCPVCSGGQIRRDYEGQTTRPGDSRVWRVDRCDGCGHGFMNPQPSWDELAPYYPATYQPYETSHAQEAADELVIAEARRTGEFRHVPIKPGDRVLDVGCGGGYFVRVANKLGAVARGVEPSQVGAERARAEGLDVFHGTLEDFAGRSPGDRFDIITANHVVEHVPEPVVTLSAMKGLLAPGGFIWISVPNAACTFCRTLKARWHSTDLPLHLMQFSPESLAEAGRRAGLKVASLTTYCLPRSTASSIRQVLRHRYRVPLRLTERIGLIDRWIGPRVGRKLDAERRGEAILIRLEHP